MTSKSELVNKAASEFNKIDRHYYDLFTPEFTYAHLKLIVYLIASGLSQVEACRIAGVEYCLFREFIFENPEIMDRMDGIKNYLVHVVEMSLLKQSIGYKYEEEVAALDRAGDWQKTTIEKYKHPSIEATKFYLTNVKSEKWKNRKAIEIDPSELEDQDLINEAMEILKTQVKQESKEDDKHKSRVSNRQKNIPNRAKRTS